MKRRFDRFGMLALAAASVSMLFEAAEPRPFELRGNVAVVDVCGPLTHHADFWWDNYDAIVERVGAALASQASGVVMRIDSPGGVVEGCFETSRKLRAMIRESGKTVVAFVDGMATSAAYALACAASQIVVPPTSRVGSIGVINALVDQTGADAALGLRFSIVASGARKADGHPHTPITRDAVAALQREVDQMADLFFGLVSESRPALSADAARALEAATFLGSSAVAAGLADVVGTFDDALAMVAGGQMTAPARASENTDMDKKEEAISALRALAEGDDETQAKAAKAALKALGVDDTEESKAEGEDEKKDDAPPADGKAEGEEPDGDEPKDAPAPKDEAKASKAEPSLKERVAQLEQARERDRLLATRPDLTRDPAMRKLLARAPLGEVRDFIAKAPKAPTPNPAAAASPAVKPTAGATQDRAASALPPDEALELKRRMGLAASPSAIRHVGRTVEFGAMTNEEAQARLKEMAR